MAVIKCKMCGGDLNIGEGSSVVECEYCGSRQTIPTADNEKKLTLFARAGRLLRGCEFDKASGVFESIVADFPEEAEAYWGLVLCRYGIEYVDDPATGKKVPTCHRSSFDSVLDDPNFEQACENGDAIARRVYREEARQIEELRKGIIEVSGKEAPYDIFISYKETDDQGNRTLDSVIAQDLYNELTEKGYRVFFSRISLEDKLGVEYEPYIFAALNSAKLMLVVGTDYEHFDAVWVKNEWSRFLKLISSGQKKVLIPVFKNMDAYDMPKEFAKLSAQDMGKVGAMQDLLRGVEKILGGKAEEKKETVVIQQSSGGPNVQAMLDRGSMALEDKKWEDAQGFFNRALDMDAKCGEAYLGLFLVESNCRNADEYAAAQIEKLRTCQSETLTACEPQEDRIQKAIQNNVVPGYLTAEELAKLFEFDCSYSSSLSSRRAQLHETEQFFNQDRSLSRIRQYAVGETAEKLKGMENKIFAFLKDAIAKAQAEDDANIACITAEYSAHLEKAEDTASRMGKEAQSRREEDYKDACRAFEQASERRDYVKLSDRFERMEGYKDSAEMKQRCGDALQRLIEQEKKKAKEEQEKEEARKRKKKKFFMAVGITAVLALAVFMFITKIIIPTKQYNAAMEQFTGGDYEGAIIAFESLGDFKDSTEKRMEAKYAAAEAKYAAGDYAGAVIMFESLGDFKDSTEKRMEAKYAAAEAKYAAGDYAGAIIAFESLGDFKDSTEKCAEVKYLVAETKYAAGEYIEAAMMFFKAGDYKDSKERYIEASQKSGLHQTVSAGFYHTVGLKSDGTVISTEYTGIFSGSQCDVYGWRDIVSISAGEDLTLGLKSDGTVVAAGESDYLTQILSWQDIISISIWDYHAVGLRSDGTVVVAGENGINDDRCNVDDWRDIVAISAGQWFTVGLKSDGTVVAVGSKEDGRCDVSEWTDIVAISTGSSHTVGLKSDGTVVAVGNNEHGACNVGEWTDIVAISAGNMHTVGLKSDGTVVATTHTGTFYNGWCDVGEWTDIVAISAGRDHTVGLKSDGTVVATKYIGDYYHGQCDVSDWSDIKLPEKEVGA